MVNEYALVAVFPLILLGVTVLVFFALQWWERHRRYRRYQRLFRRHTRRFDSARDSLEEWTKKHTSRQSLLDVDESAVNELADILRPKKKSKTKMRTFRGMNGSMVRVPEDSVENDLKKDPLE